jgi:hypothetical protein
MGIDRMDVYLAICSEKIDAPRLHFASALCGETGPFESRKHLERERRRKGMSARTLQRASIEWVIDYLAICSEKSNAQRLIFVSTLCGHRQLVQVSNLKSDA